MSSAYHRDDYPDEESWNLEAFRLGYNDAEQREQILDALDDGNYEMAEQLIGERFDQGDYQSLGDIYADLYDALDDLDPDEREAIIDEMFGYENA